MRRRVRWRIRSLRESGETGSAGEKVEIGGGGGEDGGDDDGGEDHPGEDEGEEGEALF